VFRRLRGLLTNPAFIYFGAVLLARGASFFLIPLYTRRLTPVEYGDYTLGQTVLGTLPGVMTLGIHSALSRFFFETPDLEEAKARAGTVARWHLLLALASAALFELLVLAACPRSGTPLGGRWELTCIVIACAGACIALIPGSYMRTTQRPLWAAAFQLVEFACVVTAGLTFVNVLSRGLRGAFEAWFAAYGVLGVVGTLFILGLPGKWSPAVLRRALHFSLPLVPHLLANQLQNIADRWTLKATGLDAQLGPYALAVQVTSPAQLLVGAYNDGAAPRMGELVSQGGLGAVERSIQAIRRRYVMVATLGAILVVAAIPIAKHLIAPKFHEALWLSPFLCAVVLVESLYYPNLNVVYFASETKIIPRITFSAAALNVALNIVFIRYAGVAGAIAARAISMTYRSVAMWIAAGACFRRAAALAADLPTVGSTLPLEGAAK